MNEYNEKIEKIRKRLARDLVILGHHYQHDNVIRHCDIQGDSLELSRKVKAQKARYIVFCGVFFMAESAAILARPDQKVFIPEVTASCVMSEMAPARLVKTVLEKLHSAGRNIIPLAYVNSSAAVKGLCGKYSGSVCTSANARVMLDWAMKQGDGVLFLPDRHLADNTADQLGIPPEKRHIVDVRTGGDKLNLDKASKARLLIWPGSCVTHHRFKRVQIENIRKQQADALIVVHPECSPEVVAASDSTGSTSHIIKFVHDAPKGSTIYVGTEINLVNRLAERYRGEKDVRPLVYSSCVNMAKITEQNLAALLENLDEAEPVRVPEEIAAPAHKALETMLEVCSR